MTHKPQRKHAFILMLVLSSQTHQTTLNHVHTDG